MSSNIDHHLYAKLNTNQAMISSFPEAAPPSHPDNHQPYLNLPTNNHNQYSAPQQNFQDPFAPSVAGQENHAVHQQNPHNQLGYPQNHQGSNFQQNHHGNYQSIQQPLVQHVQAPQQVIVQQIIHVVNQPQPNVRVNVIDYSDEDFRMLSGWYNCFKCWLLFFTTVGTICCIFSFLWKWLWGSWDMTTGAWVALIVYLSIFAKIQFDAIAEMKLSKAKTAMRGFLGYFVYYWIVMAIASKVYNSDVGTLGTSLIQWYILPIPTLLLGSISVKGKLTRYENHKRGTRLAQTGSY